MTTAPFIFDFITGPVTGPTEPLQFVPPVEVLPSGYAAVPGMITESQPAEQ